MRDRTGRDTTGTGRLARAAVFGVSSTCLAAAAHLAAGGGRPSAVLVAAAALLLTRVAFGLAGRERGLVGIAAGIMTAQLGLHTSFVLATHHPAGVTGPGRLPGEMAGAGDHLLASLLPDASMIAGHTLAAWCVALLLRRCERRLWAAAALRAAVARAAAVVARVIRAMIAALRGAHRIALARAAAGACRARAGAVGVLSSRSPAPAAVARRAGGAAGVRWQAHVLLLGTDAGRRGPPAPRPGSRPLPVC